jgi:hypothetical protein
MYRRTVTSSNVRSVGYDPIKRIVEVEFVTGDIYQYISVPEQVHTSLMTSASIGKAIHSMLRGKYQFKKVEA